MRKAVIGFLLAATAATPFAAQAQDSDARRQRIEQRYERLEQRNQQRAEQREAQREAVQERQQTPQERQQARQQRVQARAARVEQRQDRIEQRQQRVEQRRDTPVVQPRGTRQGSDGRNWGGTSQRDRAVDRRPSSTERAWQGDRNDPRMERHRRRYEQLERRNQREWQRDQREDDPEWRGDRRGDRRDWRNERRGDRRWDRSWRNDRRYDWQNWRYSNRHLYRQPGYYAPYRGHRYSRFSIGLILGQPFFHQRYWIDDPWQYRLPHAGPGYAWVRYYDDVLLVDTWTGEVVDVIHDFFW